MSPRNPGAVARARARQRGAGRAWAQLGFLAGAWMLVWGVAGGWGCRPKPGVVPENALVVTQVLPAGKPVESGMEALDAAYPAGSRVVYVPRPEDPARVVVLSEGLYAAGGPAAGPDGREILFTGKTAPGAPWQVYRAGLSGGRPRAVTDLPGGAMSPAWMPGGRLVFASPVPRGGGGAGGGGAGVTALYSLSVTGGIPVRLTHGLVAALDPVVLSDGRILFVSSVPGPASGSGGGLSLFTVNNDGTEVNAYAGQHDGPAAIRRPRESADGRVLFLTAGVGSAGVDGRIEQVLTARPFRSRTVTHPQLAVPCRAVEPDRDGTLLASLCEPGPDRARATFAVYRLGPEATRLGDPVFDDPAWDDVEAVLPAHAPRPMGRISGVQPERRDGVLLCLDARLSDRPLEEAVRRPGSGVEPATVRVSRWTSTTTSESLGEAPVLADGSFLVRVPSDVPLGIELLDAARRVIRRCPPGVWLRPGENRSCVGCHEPHNRAPDNGRPLAVRREPVPLLGGSARPATGSGGGVTTP